ncbi:Putative ATP synthase subunit f, mitochondrial, partial [Eufriesea mexicana]
VTDVVHVKNWTKYPEGYNRAQHGPYNPGRYYGKPDTPFSEVKLNELFDWFKRRDFGFKQTASLFSRAHWRWQLKYVQPRKAGITPLYQVCAFGLVSGYIMNYGRIRGHRHYEYH